MLLHWVIAMMSGVLTASSVLGYGTLSDILTQLIYAIFVIPKN